MSARKVCCLKIGHPYECVFVESKAPRLSGDCLRPYREPRCESCGALDGGRYAFHYPKHVDESTNRCSVCWSEIDSDIIEQHEIDANRYDTVEVL